MFRHFDHQQATETNWIVATARRRSTGLPIPEWQSRHGNLLLTVVLFGTVLYALFVSLNSTTVHEPLIHTVTYRVGGTNSLASVAMADYEGRTSKHASVPVAWEYTHRVPIGSTLYVSAQVEGRGTIWVEIWVDGHLVKAKTSQGEETVAPTAARL